MLDNTIKLKYIANSFSSSLNMESVLDEGLYKVYGASGLIGYRNEYILNRDYIGIIKDGAGIGKTFLCENKTSLLGTMAYIYPKNDLTSYLPFIKYAIDAMDLGNNGGNITTIPHIYFSKYGNNKIFYPDFNEQIKIVNYLDKKCIEIDLLFNDIRSQIEILQDYKKSVITEAVTKGLNSNVDMKESQIKWIGKVPKNWMIVKISNLYKIRNTKVSDTDYEPLSVTMQGIVPQLENAAKSNSHDDRKLVKKGDFVINSRSDRRGSCGISSYDGSVSLINHVLEPTQIINPVYYNWLFHSSNFSNEFYKWGHGIVADLWTTNWQDMKHIDIPFPPFQEQQKIADYLDKKCSEIEAIITNKKEQLETLTEYKKSIIYEYVTGKKDVLDNE